MVFTPSQSVASRVAGRNAQLARAGSLQGLASGSGYTASSLPSLASSGQQYSSQAEQAAAAQGFPSQAQLAASFSPQFASYLQPLETSDPAFADEQIQAAQTAAVQNMYASQFVNPYAAWMGWTNPIGTSNQGYNFATDPMTNWVQDPNIPGDTGTGNPAQSPDFLNWWFAGAGGGPGGAGGGAGPGAGGAGPGGGGLGAPSGGALGTGPGLASPGLAGMAFGGFSPSPPGVVGVPGELGPSQADVDAAIASMQAALAGIDAALSGDTLSSADVTASPFGGPSVGGIGDPGVAASVGEAAAATTGGIGDAGAAAAVGAAAAEGGIGGPGDAGPGSSTGDSGTGAAGGET